MKQTLGLAISAVDAGAQQQETLLTFGITGCEGESNYSSVMRQGLYRSCC